MKIAVTNDDGIYAEGIDVLANVAAEFGDVTVIAPRHHHSGCSHQMTFDGHLDAADLGGKRYWIDGYPADCVRIALAEICPDVDLVLGTHADTGAACLADAYDDAAPDLLDVLGNLTVTSRTITEKRQQLDTFFIGVCSSSRSQPRRFQDADSGTADFFLLLGPKQKAVSSRIVCSSVIGRFVSRTSFAKIWEISGSFRTTLEL